MGSWQATRSVFCRTRTPFCDSEPFLLLSTETRGRERQEANGCCSVFLEVSSKPIRQSPESPNELFKVEGKAVELQRYSWLIDKIEQMLCVLRWCYPLLNHLVWVRSHLYSLGQDSPNTISKTYVSTHTRPYVHACAGTYTRIYNRSFSELGER